MDPRTELRRLNDRPARSTTPRSRELRQQRAEILEGWVAVLDGLDEHRATRSQRSKMRPTLLRGEQAIAKLDREIAAEERGQPETFDPGLLDVSTRRATVDADTTTLGPEQRMADWSDRRGGYGGFSGSMLSEINDPDRFSLGRTIRGYVTGEWQDAELEHRALSEGVSADGGFLLPQPISSRVIDRIRAKMRVMQVVRLTGVGCETLCVLAAAAWWSAAAAPLSVIERAAP